MTGAARLATQVHGRVVRRAEVRRRTAGRTVRRRSDPHDDCRRNPPPGIIFVFIKACEGDDPGTRRVTDRPVRPARVPAFSSRSASRSPRR